MAERIASPADLAKVREKAKAEIDLRSGEKAVRITVHMGTCGIASGARDVLLALADEIAASGISTVTLGQSGCLGLCAHEPMLTVRDASGREWRYGKLDGTKARRVVREHVVGNEPVNDCLVKA